LPRLAKGAAVSVPIYVLESASQLRSSALNAIVNIHNDNKNHLLRLWRIGLSKQYEVPFLRLVLPNYRTVQTGPTLRLEQQYSRNHQGRLRRLSLVVANLRANLSLRYVSEGHARKKLADGKSSHRDGFPPSSKYLSGWLVLLR